MRVVLDTCILKLATFPADNNASALIFGLARAGLIEAWVLPTILEEYADVLGDIYQRPYTLRAYQSGSAAVLTEKAEYVVGPDGRAEVAERVTLLRRASVRTVDLHLVRLSRFFHRR